VTVVEMTGDSVMVEVVTEPKTVVTGMVETRVLIVEFIAADTALELSSTVM
jgi:hypothetical protein